VAGAPPETRDLTYWLVPFAAGHLRQAHSKRGAGLAGVRTRWRRSGEKGPGMLLCDSRVLQRPLIEAKMGWAWIRLRGGQTRTRLAREADGRKEARDLPGTSRSGVGKSIFGARKMACGHFWCGLGPAPNKAWWNWEYKEALRLSPNRFNGTCSTGQPGRRKAMGGPGRQGGGEGTYYRALLASTDPKRLPNPRGPAFEPCSGLRFACGALAEKIRKREK